MKLMPSKVLIIVILIAISLTTNLFAANDFEAIENRLLKKYISQIDTANLDLSKMKVDGSFLDINYKNDTKRREHLVRLNQIALKYYLLELKSQKSIGDNSSNTNLGDLEKLSNSYFKGLNYWVNTNFKVNNWWARHIAYTRDFSKGLLLMSDKLKSFDIKLYEKSLDYLLEKYISKGYMNGTNGADKIVGSMVATILKRDEKQLAEMTKIIDDLIVIQNKGEGWEADYMFGMHSSHGRQLYLGTYGKAYMEAVLGYSQMVYDTDFALKNIDILAECFVNSFPWVIYKNTYDKSISGRKPTMDKIKRIDTIAQTLYEISSPRFKASLAKAKAVLLGDSLLIGNRSFWRFDYMVHRREGFFSSARLTSTRTTSSEYGNNEGAYNYYSGSGTNYIIRSGKEYIGQYYKKFNPRQFPGITAEQDKSKKLPLIKWGKNGKNGSEYAGGVSDGTYGHSAMILNKKGIKAYKSLFFFDDEIVALGAGITQIKGNGEADVYTTINQVNSFSKPFYKTSKVAKLDRLDVDTLDTTDSLDTANSLDKLGANKIDLLDTTGSLDIIDTLYTTDIPDFLSSIDIQNRSNISDSLDIVNSLGIIDTLNTIETTLDDTKWIIHDSIAYFPHKSSPIILSNKKDIVSIAINHGTNPKNKSYQYIIAPNIVNSAGATDYLSKKAITIESNTTKIQAVRHNILKQVHVVFYEAGTLKYSNGIIKVDHPCLLIYNEKDQTIHIANPRGKKHNPSKIRVNVVGEKISFVRFYEMPQGDYAGKTIFKAMDKN